MIGEPTGSTVELNWLPPLHPNGAIHYEIEYEPVMTPGDTVNAGSSSNPYFTLTLPNEFLTYNVSVVAKNTQGQARSDIIIVKTEKGMHIRIHTQGNQRVRERGREVHGGFNLCTMLSFALPLHAEYLH